MIPRLDPIDAEEAADHVANLEDAAVTYPFSINFKNKSEAPTQPSNSSPEPSKKGTPKTFKREKSKYGSHNNPKSLKKLFTKLSKIPSKWRKYFLKTGSASLARSTWNKYSSAYKAFCKFCFEENISNPWPLFSKKSSACSLVQKVFKN